MSVQWRGYDTRSTLNLLRHLVTGCWVQSQTLLLVFPPAMGKALFTNAGRGPGRRRDTILGRRCCCFHSQSSSAPRINARSICCGSTGQVIPSRDPLHVSRNPSHLIGRHKPDSAKVNETACSPDGARLDVRLTSGV